MSARVLFTILLRPHQERAPRPAFRRTFDDVDIRGYVFDWVGVLGCSSEAESAYDAISVNRIGRQEPHPKQNREHLNPGLPTTNLVVIPQSSNNQSARFSIA